MSKTERDLELIESCLPNDTDVRQALDDIKDMMQWFNERAVKHYGRELELKEALVNTAKSVKSNNEHVRKLKGNVQAIVNRFWGNE